LEFVMVLVSDMGEKDLKKHLFKKRKEQLIEIQTKYSDETSKKHFTLQLIFK